MVANELSTKTLPGVIIFQKFPNQKEFQFKFQQVDRTPTGKTSSKHFLQQ